MVNRIILAIVIGVIVAIVAGLLGTLLIELDLERVGRFLQGVAGLLGLLAALWYYVTGKSVLGQ